MKPFFITIDTEGDCLWDNPKEISTENSLWIPRFQELCEKYGFIPIWLTDFEMANDDRFVNYMREKAQRGLCEIGIHVHAKNSPPLYSLKNEHIGAAFLIEYPRKIIYEKTAFLKYLLEDKFGVEIKTHRAGRWALNQEYIDILIELGIKYDCSVTPYVDWSQHGGITPNGKGSDYSKERNKITWLHHSADINKKMAEFPVSIYPCNCLISPSNISVKSILKSIYAYIYNVPVWLRPIRDNFSEMVYVLNKVEENKVGFAEYMIHSSELMPGGSPNFSTKASINILYCNTERIFKIANKMGYTGQTFEMFTDYILTQQ